MTACGVYDIAAMSRNGASTGAENHRVIAGGGWNEPEYMFRMADKYPPLPEANFGLAA
jgi:hypothetical protein